MGMKDREVTIVERKKTGARNRIKKKRSQRLFKSVGRQNNDSCSSTCIDTAISNLKLYTFKVATLQKQLDRMLNFEKISGNKEGKKDAFVPIFIRLVQNSGGDASNLICGAQTNGTGFEQNKNLTETLRNCSADVEAACGNYPSINQTVLEACNSSIVAFEILAKECMESASCDCWTGDEVTEAANNLKALKCDFKAAADEEKKHKDNCKNAFGKCRKYEDDTGDVINECMQPVAPVTAPTEPAPVTPTTPGMITEAPTSMSSEETTGMSSEGPTNMSSEQPTSMSSEKTTSMSSEGPTGMNSEGPTSMSTEGPTSMSTEGPTPITTEDPVVITSDMITDMSTGGPTDMSTGGPTDMSTGGSTTQLILTTEDPYITANKLDNEQKQLAESLDNLQQTVETLNAAESNIALLLAEDSSTTPARRMKRQATTPSVPQTCLAVLEALEKSQVPAYATEEQIKTANMWLEVLSQIDVASIKANSPCTPEQRQQVEIQKTKLEETKNNVNLVLNEVTENLNTVIELIEEVNEILDDLGLTTLIPIIDEALTTVVASQPPPTLPQPTTAVPVR